MNKIKTNNKKQDNIINIYNDYISLNQIAKYKNTKNIDEIIKNWIKKRGTIDFLSVWERIHNPYFKKNESDKIKNDLTSNDLILSPQKWIRLVNAIGLNIKQGRKGGTFAHKDIATHFSSWISAEYNLYIIKEFNRLKVDENYRNNLNWNIDTHLTKINYKIDIDSVKENIQTPVRLSQKSTFTIYEGDYDILNMSLFNITSKNWKLNNKNKIGNMRDYLNIYQLIYLSILESFNFEFIKMHMNKEERLFKLNDEAISKIKSLLQTRN